MTPQDKRDLPEVVAEILIEQHAMREEITAMREEITAMRQEMLAGNVALRQEIHESNAELRDVISESNAALRGELRANHEGLVHLFNGMTNAILDAMNRATDRYEQTNEEVDKLKTRVTHLENPAAGAA